MMTATLGRRGQRTSAGGGARVQPSSRLVEAEVRQVYDAHYGRLAGWTLKLVGDPDLAHDLATEAFVRLLRNWSQVSEPRPWLYSVTANLVRDHWRRGGREAVAYQRWEVAQPLEPGGADPADRLSVRDAVLALPDRLRAVVLLHYFADLPVATVAAQLGKSEGAVKRDLYDARARLAVFLEEVR